MLDKKKVEQWRYEASCWAFNLLEEAIIKNTLLRAPLFEWYNRFSEEGENLGDERSDRLITKKTDDNVGNVTIVVRTDHQNDDTGI